MAAAHSITYSSSDHQGTQRKSAGGIGIWEAFTFPRFFKFFFFFLFPQSFTLTTMETFFKRTSRWSGEETEESRNGT